LNKILIVDDSAFMRIAIKNILEKNGFEVIAEAEDGSKALLKYKQFHPDIVTMDITMPDVNGLEALRSILNYDPKAKVVMVSSMGQESIVKEAILLGAKSFILKPFKEDHVVQTMKRLT